MKTRKFTISEFKDFTYKDLKLLCGHDLNILGELTNIKNPRSMSVEKRVYENGKQKLIITY